VSATALVLTTLLGDNAVAMSRALAPALARATGLGVRFDCTGEPRSSAERAVWERELVWACGLLTLRTIDAGGAVCDIVAAPVFAGEASPVYRSVIVARTDGPVRTTDGVARCRIAINETASWSGCHCLLAHLADTDRTAAFAACTLTGSHRRSVEAVVDGRADAAAIDESVWRHLMASEPASVEGLAVIEHTADWPAPPISLARTLDPALRERVLDGLLGPGPADVAGLERIEPVDAGRYRTMVERAERQASGFGVAPLERLSP